MSKMFDAEDKITSSHVEKASQYRGAPVLFLIIASASVSVNTRKFPFKIAVATATVRYMSFSLDLIFKNYNYLFNAGHVVIQYQP